MKQLYWHYRYIINELKYSRDLLFDRLSKNEKQGKPKIRYTRFGNLKPDYNQAICLFCSFDKNCTVSKNVYYYLNALKQAGFNIIFISSSDSILNNDLEKLASYCILIINRENRGYDFYGWKAALQQYPQYPMHKALLLANDSVLGPLFSIGNIIGKLEENAADIVSMTDSLQFHPHLQSYFLYCKKPVSTSREFANFFNEVDELGSKMAIVRTYEIGFSRSLSRYFKLSALYNLEASLNYIQYAEKPANWIDLTHDLWKPLITDLKFPFIKKRLVVKRDLSIEEIMTALTKANASYGIDLLNDFKKQPLQTISVKNLTK
ncbi:MAG: lipopolysaccharide biosynthesis protein [Nitrosomonas sp.]|nr:MAG: lipopolysaccharide biosynthesis protein [Nitrosomonas sp.]